MTTKGAILASPLLCLGVLTVIAADNARHVKPHDVDPYHARARAAIGNFPYVIPASSWMGTWTGSNMEVPDAAVKLLHNPNALISRRYTNTPRHTGHDSVGRDSIGRESAGHQPTGRGSEDRQIWADLLILQCADSRDMTGHYPPMCYPSNGESLLSSRLFHLKAGDIWIDGTEYQFEAKPGQGCERKSVYNFFVVPGRGIVAGIKDVRAAAGDYQRRYFGAAQFQVIIDADQPPEVRDDVFCALVGADTRMIKTLELVNLKE